MQVVFGHVEGDHVQLPVLVCLDHYLHHGYHTHQYFLHGLPGGVFLLPAVWRRAATQTHQEDLALLGLPDSLQRLCHHNEERLFCEISFNISIF